MALLDHVGHSAADAEFRIAAPVGEARPYPWPSVPASVFDILSSSNDNQSSEPEIGHADELNCLRRVLAPALLRAAERRGRALGIGGDQVLIRAGIIDEETYLDHLAFHLDLTSETSQPSTATLRLCLIGKFPTPQDSA